MKVRPLLLFIAVILFLSSGCEKSIFNYRKKYLGDYNFSYDVNTYQMGQPPTSTHNHEDHEGYLDFGDKGEIDVYFGGSYSMSFLVDKNGNISIECAPTYKVGEFTSKNHFLMSYGSWFMS